MKNPKNVVTMFFLLCIHQAQDVLAFHTKLLPILVGLRLLMRSTAQDVYFELLKGISPQ